MKKLSGFRDFRIGPLTIPMDARSGAGELGLNELQLALNMDTIEQKKRCRMGGWRKFLSDTPYGFHNHDLHDQMLGCQFYFESFSETIHIPSGIDGYSYPYWFPGESIDGGIGLRFNDRFCGYYPDFINDGSYTNADGYLNHGLFSETGGPNTYFMRDQFIGWDFNFVAGDENSPCAYYDTDRGAYYVGSYFYGEYIEEYADSEVAAYGYGSPLIPHVVGARTYERSYCGEDLYYQSGCNEAVSLLFEAVSDSGNRKLIAGTKSRIYVNDERDGSWRIIADRLGGPYTESNCGCHWRRFKAAQVGNIILFANGFDPVLSWTIDDGPYGCNFWSADYVVDLALLGIDSAKVVSSWNGFAFIGNTIEGANRRKSRLYWSDYNDPRSWASTSESLAGYQDFGKDEEILAIEPIGGVIRVYTTRAHYEGTLVGGTEVFHFREVYRGEDTIRYPNSFISAGDAHFYLGEDSLYVTTETNGSPTRVEWMHRAASPIFNGVDAESLDSFTGLDAFGPVNIDAIEQVVGGYDFERKTLWFSWPSDDNNCPNMSLILNRLYGTASIVDHGFTAFRSHIVDYVQSIRNWLAELGVCDPFGLLASKEGVPYMLDIPSNPPAYIVNETENPDLPSDPNSLCALLGDQWLEDLCHGPGRDMRFVMASAGDFCLKEFTPTICARERYSPAFYNYDCPYTVPGNYVLDGYYSMMQWGALDFGVETEKLINKSAVEYTAAEQTTPNQLYMQFGYGMQAGCMLWADPISQEMACLTASTDAEHKAAKSRPSLLAGFNTYRRGSRLTWRIYIDGTGGSSCFHSVTVAVRNCEGDW